MRLSTLRLTLGVILIQAIGSASFASAQSEAPEPKKPPVMSLPGGASSISETHGSWAVNCQVLNNTRLCAFSHQQTDNKNQRIFAVEFSPRSGGAAGTVALPFGLDLQKGASLTVDDKPFGERLSFSTCIMGGCLVPVELDDAKLAVLAQGNTLVIKALALEGGRELSFSVPLQGFSSARERTRQLLDN